MDYTAWFSIADVDGDGRVSGAEAVHFFMRAGLPKNELAKLWDAADAERVGYLDQRAFSVACALVGALQQYGTITRDAYERARSGAFGSLPTPKMQGLELPSMVAARYARGSRRNSFEAGASAPPLAPATQPRAAAAFDMNANEDLFAMSGGFDDSFSVAAAPVTVAVPAQSNTFPPPPTASLTVQNAPAPVPAIVQPQQIVQAVEWPVIGPSDWQRYQQVFLTNTRGNPEGRLSGQEVAPILLGLDAPKHVLKDIWELSDADKDGSLSWLEFVVAIYLTEQARNGRMPPPSLPAGQFPPFSMTAGASVSAQPQPEPQQPAAPIYQPQASFQTTATGLMTQDAARAQLQHVMTSAPRAAEATEEYTYRGPVANVAAMPEQDQELAARVRANAESNDRELWESEMAERQNKLSAAAAQEVLSNLAIFTRKCEADLTEASYRAQAAEAEVKDIKAKCERMQGMVQNIIDQMGEPMHRIEEAKKEYDALSVRYKELEERHAELVAPASSGTSAVEQNLVDMREKVRAKTIAVETEEARLRAGAFASSTAAAQQSSLETKRQDIALAEHQRSSSFFDVSAPVPPRERAPVAMSPGTKDGRESFDAWDNWATTSRAEKNTMATATATPHRRFPSEIPAVAAALGIPSDTGGGGFFDSLDDDSDPFGGGVPAPPPQKSSPANFVADFAAPSDASFDDPFGAPPPTPPGADPFAPSTDAHGDDDVDDPFGAPPPTPPPANNDPFAL